MTYRYREWVQRNECHFVLHRWYGWLVKATDFHRLLVVLELFISWWFCAGMVVSCTFHPVDHTLKSINPALYALVLSPYACNYYSNTFSSVPGIPRLPLDQHSLSCCKLSVNLRSSSSAGLRRTWEFTHKLQCWELPWRLAKISTLNYSRCIQIQRPLVILNYSAYTANTLWICFIHFLIWSKYLAFRMDVVWICICLQSHPFSNVLDQLIVDVIFLLFNISVLNWTELNWSDKLGYAQASAMIRGGRGWKVERGKDSSYTVQL